jgi:hypothetical protein
MENPVPGKRATPSVTLVLKKISDDKALILFNFIVASSTEIKYTSLKAMNLSTKQYYSRMSGLLKVGLIRRHKGRYIPTLLGRVVYDSQMLIGKTLSYYWQLKAIESVEIESTHKSNLDAVLEVPREEITKLITALIDNRQIKNILLEAISNTTREGNLTTQTQTVLAEQIQDYK